MPSTPKHLVLYAAFGWQPPIFAHVGLLLDEKRQKLSKRNMDVDIGSYKNQGIFPEALLGWSHSKGKDFIPLEKMIEIVRFTTYPDILLQPLTNLCSSISSLPRAIR